MPVYEYEHIESPCRLGAVFEVRQTLAEAALTACPACGQPVKKILSLNFVNTPKCNAELRDMGFTKLVRRDDGVYENVTRRGSESRYMQRGKPGTLPHIHKTITD